MSGEQRKINVQVTSDADCSSETHPVLEATTDQALQSKVGKELELTFHRADQSVDGTAGPALYEILRAAFESTNTSTFSVSATSCGMPTSPGSGSVQALGAVIEVFPADQFSAEISLPALHEVESLKFERASTNWTSDRDRQKKA